MKPAYQSNSTANILPAILQHFGCQVQVPPQPDLLRQLEGKQKALFLMIDGLGYHQLKKEFKHPLFLKQMSKKGKLLPITACFPSTTAASVTSFFTGLTPQQHGIMAYTVYLHEYKALTSMLSFHNLNTRKPVKIKGRFIKCKTIGEQLAQQHIPAHAVIPSKIIKGTLSQNIHRKTTVHGYKNLHDCFEQIKKLLKKPGKAYIHAYIDFYDGLCHEHGPESDVSCLFLHGLDSLLERFVKTTKAKDTLLAISADHGHITTDPKKTILYRDHPKLCKALVSIGGEARINYLYCKKGKQKFVEKYFKKHFTQYATLHKSQDILKQGLFGIGTPNEKTAQRIGDFVVMAKKNNTLLHSPAYLIGHHGGLSKEELIVPLLLYPL
ncbi:alkaline phosphatase family protein [Candidatus Woesearchaeota archaeon]|nr:alkaline phosphatase family protein [Candidatus Woesearchaeota archaeon]